MSVEGEEELAEDLKVEDSAARVVAGPNDVEFAVLLSSTLSLVVISDVVGRAVVVGFGRAIEACFFFFSSASAMDRAMALAMISSSLIVVFVGSCCCFPVGRLWLDVVRAGGATGVLFFLGSSHVVCRVA